MNGQLIQSLFTRLHRDGFTANLKGSFYDIRKPLKGSNEFYMSPHISSTPDLIANYDEIFKGLITKQKK
jgi:hypothetical protein